MRTGEPAFPSTYEWRNDSDMNGRAPNGMPVPPGGSESIHASGMTLRDYFAAKAMQALIREYFDANGRCMGTDHPYSNVPSHAYKMADAMLAARLREPGQ